LADIDFFCGKGFFMEAITPRLLVTNDNLRFLVRGIFECRIFIAAWRGDREFEESLRKHLSTTHVKKYNLKICSEKDVEPGVNVKAQIKKWLDDSDITLALISVDFLADEDCLELYPPSQEKWIPILLKKDCVLPDEISEVSILPGRDEPIDHPQNRDAFIKVVTALEKVFQNHYQPYK